MKKSHLTAAVLAVLLLIVITGIPYLVGRDSTRLVITRYIEAVYNIELETDNLHWSWLPLPHLNVYGSVFTYNRGLTCTLPHLKIYPDWTRVVVGRIEPDRLEITRPHFVIKPDLFKKGLVVLPRLPAADVLMDEASLSLNSPQINDLPALSLDLGQGELEIKNLAGRLYLSLEAVSPSADNISLQGWFSRLTGNYSLTASLDNFRLHKLVPADSDLFAPMNSEIDLEWHLEGTGRYFESSYQGGFPDFILKRPTDRSSNIAGKAGFQFGKVDLELINSEEGLFLTARDVELNTPSLTISGEVKRLRKEAEPLYDLDLEARKIDLTEVRRSLLDLLGGEQITGLVCSIVRGGEASRANYRFKAPARGFADIRNMRIGVDVTSSEIVVPGIDLHLDQVKGTIRIEDGILSGADLMARLGQSYGKNATLSLGLIPSNHLFQLEIDLDADLSQLPNVLYHLLEKEAFQREIKKFQGRGRARAHLSIGDSLEDFRTVVDLADASKAVINYERFYWPIVFEKGTITVHERKVGVRNCFIESGPHRLQGMSGFLSWREKEPFLAVDSLEGRINPADLLEYLETYPAVGETLDRHLKSIEGGIHLKRTTMSGPLFTPEKWNYSLALDLAETEIVSPHLQGEINIKKSQVLLEDHRVRLDDTDLVFRQSPLSLEARLHHELFAGWRGQISAAGTMEPELAVWLGKRRGFPPFLLPATPCRLENLELDWDARRLNMEAALSRKNSKGEPAHLYAGLEKGDSAIKQLQLEFATPAESAIFTFRDHAEPDGIVLEWQGALKTGTLETLLSSPPFTVSDLRGNLRTDYHRSGTMNLEARGYLELKDLRWQKYLPGITVNNLLIKGKGQLIDIENLRLNYRGEEAEINGSFTGGEKPELDLLVSSTFLSQDTVDEFISETAPLWNGAAGFFKNGGKATDLESRIALDVNSFMFSVPKGEEGEENVLLLRPLKARAFEDQNDDLHLALEDSGFCGLILNGLLSRQEGKFQVQEINGTNPGDHDIYFESTLPCLGIEDSIIEGPFHTEFSLTMEQNTYKSGLLNINSEKGRILKWGLLAKIFQVVNITELDNLLKRGGFNYDKLTGEAHISDDRLIIDKAELKGQGLDLLAHGHIDLQEMTMDVTVFLVPFKTIDAILNRIPLIGRLIQGREGHIITIPVGVQGDLKDPAVTALPPKAVGKGAINFIRDTISFPLDILPGQVTEEEKEE